VAKNRRGGGTGGHTKRGKGFQGKEEFSLHLIEEKEKVT